MNEKTAQTIDLSFLRSRAVQKRIAIATLAFAAAGLLYGLLAPKWYPATLTVVPAKPAPSGAASLLSGELGGLAGTFAGLGGGAADTGRIAAVLQSVAVSDAVIAKFNLGARYDTASQEATRDALWSHCSVRILPKPNLVQLACEDRDPKFVQEMVAYFASYGNEVFRRVNVGSASEEVRFLERRVAELRAQADETASRVREFQETNQIVDLETQARAVVSSVAAVNAQRINKQLELDYARTFSASDEPGARQLESQLSVVDETLRDLERSRARAGSGNAAAAAKAGGAGLFPAALAVPKLRADFEKLYRDRKVAEATLIFSRERLEAAKAAEARDISTFQVLDPPTLATRKSRPRGSLTMLFGASLGLAGSMGFEAWKARRRTTTATS